MSIELVNLRKKRPQHKYDILVDRRTVLGNPFGDPKLSRDQQCDQHAIWFRKQMHYTTSAVHQEMQRLSALHQKYGKLRLFCWCVPLRCHSETIADWLLYGSSE